MKTVYRLSYFAGRFCSIFVLIFDTVFQFLVNFVKTAFVGFGHGIGSDNLVISANDVSKKNIGWSIFFVTYGVMVFKMTMSFLNR